MNGSNPARHRFTRFFAIAALALTATSPLLHADDSGSSEDVGQYLGPVYKDELAGIKICPPVGSRIINRAGLDLVSFVNDTKQWGGSVTTVVTKQKMTVEGYLSSTAAELGRTFRAVQVLESRELTFQSHPAGRITSSMQAELGAAPGTGKVQAGAPHGAAGEVIALFRQQLVIQLGDNSFIVLTLYVPLKDRDAAAATFDAMLTSFELLDRNELAKKREVAVDLGKKWLAHRTADELRAKLILAPQLFRLKAGGADMGFLQFNESESTQNNTSGVRVLVTSRGFKPDGANISSQIDSYWSFSGEDSPKHLINFSQWSNTTKTVLNKPGVPLPNQTFWLEAIGTVQAEGGSPFTAAELADLKQQREELLKKHPPADKVPPPIAIVPKVMHIHVAYDGDKSQPPVQPMDAYISEDHPAVLPPVLDYLWPRVVDVTQKTEMTFVVYNSIARKLMFRTLSTRGPDHIVINKAPVDCFRCEDELDTSSTTLWVDEKGKILMMRTSDQSLLLPTTEDEMHRLWAGRINQPH